VPIAAEAQEKVNKMKPLVKLTDKQVEKMLLIEKEFLTESKKLTYSPTYNAKLTSLNDKRIEKIKGILSRDQFITFGIMENKKIKDVPLRF